LFIHVMDAFKNGDGKQETKRKTAPGQKTIWHVRLRRPPENGRIVPGKRNRCPFNYHKICFQIPNISPGDWRYKPLNGYLKWHSKSEFTLFGRKWKLVEWLWSVLTGTGGFESLVYWRVVRMSTAAVLSCDWKDAIERVWNAQDPFHEQWISIMAKKLRYSPQWLQGRPDRDLKTRRPNFNLLDSWGDWVPLQRVSFVFRLATLGPSQTSVRNISESLLNVVVIWCNNLSESMNPVSEHVFVQINWKWTENFIDSVKKLAWTRKLPWLQLPF
jgi:hypothetical protein